MKRFALAATAVVVLAACRGDGRSLRAPSTDQSLSIATTTTTIAKIVSGAVATTAGVASTVRSARPGDPTLSAAWVDGGAMPVDLTCKGGSLSPALTWTGVPGEVVELGISVIDLDNGQAVHWVLAGIDPATTAIAKGVAPRGAVQAKNYLGVNGWAPACPNSGVHRFLFTLYFLPRTSGVVATMEGVTALETLDLAASQRVTLTGTVTAT